MRFLPFARVTLYTQSPPDVVVEKLSVLVTPRWFSLRPPPQPFRGAIRDRHFKLVRVLRWARNSWRPVVVGDVVSLTGGTELRIRMRLHAFVAAFMALWFGGLLFAAAVMVWTGLTEGFGPHVRNGRQVAGAGVGLPFVAAMVLAGYLMMSFAFWAEVKKARLLLCEGLGCREVDGGSRLKRE